MKIFKLATRSSKVYLDTYVCMYLSYKFLSTYVLDFRQTKTCIDKKAVLFSRYTCVLPIIIGWFSAYVYCSYRGRFNGRSVIEGLFWTAKVCSKQRLSWLVRDFLISVYHLQWAGSSPIFVYFYLLCHD